MTKKINCGNVNVRNAKSRKDFALRALKKCSCIGDVYNIDVSMFERPVDICPPVCIPLGMVNTDRLSGICIDHTVSGPDGTPETYQEVIRCKYSVYLPDNKSGC